MILLPKEDIDDITYDILKSSRAFDIFPTPVDKIIHHCDLRLNSSSDFHIPRNYISKNIDAFKRMQKKILGVLDKTEKVIFIDESLVPAKKTFVKLHEVGHNAIPWQRDIHFLDNDFTLSHDVKSQFEAEANHFASGALFQLDRFTNYAKSLPLEIGSALALADKFGGSYHAAIRRYVERSNKRCALIIIEKNVFDTNTTFQVKGNYQSIRFGREFGKLIMPDILDSNFPFVKDFHAGKKLHTDGIANLNTASGEEQFQYHYFFNQYCIFVLIFPTGEKNKSRTKIVINSSQGHAGIIL